MGFDCDFRHELTIPMEQIDTAKEILEKWIAENDTDDEYLDMYPYISTLNDRVYLSFNEDGTEDNDDTCWIHNTYPHEVISKIINYLLAGGVKVTGWLFTCYDAGVDSWYDIWIDGELVKEIGSGETGDMILACLKKGII